MSDSDVALTQTRQAPDRPKTALPATVAPMSQRKATLFKVLNLATLGFIVAWLAFDWWAIAYLISH